METMKHWCTQTELEQRIKDNMAQGWSVMYVVPVWQPIGTSVPSTQYRSGSASVGSDGSICINIPGANQSFPPPSPVPQYEICFYRRDWKTEPCPRCDYPAQGDLGRDA